MFSEIITAIRKQIVGELQTRVQRGDCYLFREWKDDEEEEVVYDDIAVGYPDEMEYFGDVTKVWGGKDGAVFVTVMDAEGNERDIEIKELELSIDDLAEILDSIIEGKPVISD